MQSKAPTSASVKVTVCPVEMLSLIFKGSSTLLLPSRPSKPKPQTDNISAIHPCGFEGFVLHWTEADCKYTHLYWEWLWQRVKWHIQHKHSTLKNTEDIYCGKTESVCLYCIACVCIKMLYTACIKKKKHKVKGSVLWIVLLVFVSLLGTIAFK